MDICIIRISLYIEGSRLEVQVEQQTHRSIAWDIPIYRYSHNKDIPMIMISRFAYLCVNCRFAQCVVAVALSLSRIKVCIIVGNLLKRIKQQSMNAFQHNLYVHWGYGK